MENNFIVINFFLTLLFFLSLNHISKIIKIYDHPNKRKIHKKPIPLIGGLLIYIIITINFFIFKNIDGYIFLLSSVFFFIGLLDDIIKISAVIRLVVLSILSFIFLYSFKTYNINFLHFEGIGKVYLYSFSIFFTVLCLLLFQNSMNMIDGINGLSGSIFLTIILYISLKVNFNLSYSLIIFLLTIFLLFNLNNKLFIGDSGIYFLSTFFGLTIIKMSNNNLIYSGEIFLLMMLPGIDMLRLFIIRIIKKRNPFSPDQLHIHHLLNKTLKSNFKTLLVILTIYSLPILLKATININTIFLIISELIVYLGIINTTKGFIIYKRK